MNLSLGTIVSTLVGVAAGALVTWFLARYYYRQAAKDLEKEARRFSQIIDGTFLSLERSGWIRLARDADGKVVGMLPTLSLGSRASEANATEPPPQLPSDKTP